MKIIVVSRVLLENGENFLFVKNRGKNFWSLPGGKWEFSRENIAECATRELFEETGLKGEILRLLFAQELDFTEKNYKQIEFIFLANLAEKSANSGEIFWKDLDENSEIEKICWFSRAEILENAEIKILPTEIREFIFSGKIPENVFLGAKKV